jgi:hypothetical protein
MPIRFLDNWRFLWLNTLSKPKIIKIRRAALVFPRGATLRFAPFLHMEFPWDSVDEFPHPGTGEPMPAWAVSVVGSTKVEMSMSDERIRKEHAREEWLAVMLSNRNAAKISRVADGTGRTVTVLFGFGSPNDPMGNLMLFRVHFNLVALAENTQGPEMEHFKRALIMLVETYKELGIKLDSNFHDQVRLN